MFIFYFVAFLATYAVAVLLFMWLDVHYSRHFRPVVTKRAVCEGRCLDRPIDDNDDDHVCTVCTEVADPMKRRPYRDVMFSRLRHGTWESGGMLA
ncbi:hypothetical protein LPJ61_003501 [Coemansia biformis]|uniref:Uncharacterized protein n=1 Tax=Coemansia biformis TaxID=1286918 RepID=A0A9W8CYJ7_9FUNG|nr:hypothetical protein LPJ61_003501 [Coemansia biformis]